MATFSSILQLEALLLTLLATVVSASRQLAATKPSTLAGRALVLSVDFPDSRKSERAVWITTSSGERVRVLESEEGQHDGLRTGLRVRLKGTWTNGAGSGDTQAAAAAAGGRRHRTFKAAKVQAAQAVRASRRFIRRPAKSRAQAVPIKLPLSSNPVTASDIPTLFIPIAGVNGDGSACAGTQLPKYSITQVKRTVFQELNSNGTTVGSMYGQCSYGRTRLTAANSLVAPLVKLPCSGTTYGVSWTFSKCDFDDFSGWADAAEEALAAQGLPMEQYKYRVFLLPPSTCGFAGLAYVGCEDSYSCRSWISGDFWDNPTAITHELGHNLFLGHAGTTKPDGQTDEYGDTGSFMGYCCSQRCLNTPQAWQMGWISVLQLDATNLKPGQTVQVQLASQAVAQQSGLRVNVGSWVAGVDPIFVGFRTAEKADKGLSAAVAGKVNVYTAPTTNNYDTRPSTLHASLTAGQSWAQAASGVVLRYRSVSGGLAQVSVCRRGGAETAATCAAGIDNNCNGLAGAADPACGPLLAAAQRSGR